MQSRFTQTHPTPIKTPASLPCVSDRHVVTVAAPRCAAHSSKQQPPGQHDSDVSAVDNDLLVPARQWIEQAHKFKDAFAAQRTLSVRSRRHQGHRQLEGGIRALSQSLSRAQNHFSQARQHTRAILKLPAHLASESFLQDVQAQAPGFVSEVQGRVKAKAQTAWQSYEHALETNPMRTKALTSCVGLTVADLIAQAAEGSGWDVARTGRLASFGLLWHGLSAHMWYQFLDKVVMPENSSSTNAIVAKMVLDQAIWAPLNTALFYAYLAMADGRLSSLPDTLQAKLLPTILAGYALWPVAHLINFKYIPSHQRLLYINVVNLFWTVYLSGMANSATVIDPVQSQVHKFGVAIPVSNQPTAPPPVMQPPAPPSVVQV